MGAIIVQFDGANHHILTLLSDLSLEVRKAAPLVAEARPPPSRAGTLSFAC